MILRFFQSPLMLRFGLLAAVSAFSSEAWSAQSPAGSSPAATRSAAIGGLKFLLEDSDTADAATLSEPARALIESADMDTSKLPSPVAREAVIEAARNLLNQSCEAPLSRILLEIPQPQDGESLEQAAGKAARLLSKLPEAGKASSAPNDLPVASDDPELLAAVAAVLESLGRAAATGAAPSKESRDGLLGVCPRIAPYLDDPRATASDLARLLQATCYRRAGRPERAAELLGSVNELGGDPPYDLYLGAEHCRALADREYYVAAATLAARLEVTLASRVPVEHRTTAAHLLRSLRLGIARSRLAQAEKQGATEIADTTRAQVDRLERSFGGQEAVALYRLGAVVRLDRAGGDRVRAR